MKIAIISDTHVGVRNGGDIFLDSAEKFYSEIFFPYLLQHGIKKIIHLGDYYDHRKYVNFKSLARDRKMFLNKLDEYGIDMDIFPGNHDVYYRNSNVLSSLNEGLANFSDRVTVYNDPTVVDYDGTPIALLPWICPENYADSMKFVSECKADILMGHLGLEGFEMLKGQPAVSHGMNPSAFARFEMVLSGHYHTKSSKGNIHYLGTQFETTWADYNDPKYFHVLDTSTRELTPIRNPNTLFKKLIYNDMNSNSDANWLSNVKTDGVKGSFIKVIVANKGNPILFDKYIDKIQSAEPFELKIIETFSEFTASEISDTLVSVEDTVSLLNTYIDATETDLDKEKLKTILQVLFTEAQTLEVAS